MSGFAGAPAALTYGYNHWELNPDSQIVSQAFPDVERVQLLSPAFLTNKTQPGSVNATQAPTSLEDVDEFLQSLAGRNEWLTYKEADFTSEEGRHFPYVVLSTSPTAKFTKKIDDHEKLRVWIQASHHGNEPSGEQAALAFLGALDANQTWAISLLEDLEITVLPRYNPDGVYYFQRELASNIDPNRDHIQLRSEQTVQHKTLYNKFKADVSLDLHELSAPNVFGQKYQHGGDGFYAPGRHPLIHRLVRNVSEGLFVDSIVRNLEEYGLRPEPYATKQSGDDTEITLNGGGAEARMVSNGWGLAQTISFLWETRGIGLANEQLQRRTASAFLAIQSIVQTTADNKATIRKALDLAVKDFINSNDDIIVTYQNELVDRNFTFVDQSSGEIVRELVKFRPTDNLQANLTRSRPEAYLIPKPWAHIAEKLKFLGVEVETLDEAWEGSVEALTVSSISIANTYLEGAVPATTTTTTTVKSVKVPRGSFYINTRQKNAAYAFVALEPESVDSFVTHNTIPLRQGYEYPIFRVVT